jgi:hypothetical protein
MKHKIIKRGLNISLGILFIVNVSLFILCIGNGGVLNDLDIALVEMRELEKNDLLNNPPESISRVTKREIKLLGNSVELEKYIQETEKHGDTVMGIWFYAMAVFLGLLMARMCLAVYLYFFK